MSEPTFTREALLAEADMIDLLPHQESMLRYAATLQERLDQCEAANMSVAVCAEHTSEVVGEGCLVCECADAEAERDRLREEVAKAMAVLNPNVPESGLEDACRQVKQVAISEAENSDVAIAKLAALKARVVLNIVAREAGK